MLLSTSTPRDRSPAVVDIHGFARAVVDHNLDISHAPGVLEKDFAEAKYEGVLAAADSLGLASPDALRLAFLEASREVLLREARARKGLHVGDSDDDLRGPEVSNGNGNAAYRTAVAVELAARIQKGLP